MPQPSSYLISPPPPPATFFPGTHHFVLQQWRDPTLHAVIDSNLSVWDEASKIAVIEPNYSSGDVLGIGNRANE